MSSKNAETAKAQLRAVANLRYDRNAIRQAPELVPGERHPAVSEVQNYLKRYGYLSAQASVEARQQPGHKEPHSEWWTERAAASATNGAGQ